MANFLVWERFAWMDSAIRRNRYPNATTLADHFELSRKTAQRTIEFMRDRLHAPLEYDHSHRGYYYSNLSFELPHLQATPEEILSILLARRLLTNSAGGIISQAIQYFGEKLLLLSADLGFTPSCLDESFSAVWHSYSPVQSETFHHVAGALLHHFRLRFCYQSPASENPAERVADPHHLQHYMASWVLIAWCHERNDWRKFYLSRMSRLEVMPDTFVPRPLEEWNHLLDGAFGIFQGGEPVNVVLRFSPFRARWIREQLWHPDQTFRELPDNGLEMTLPVTDFREIKLKILQYGADVTVVAPQSLKLEIADEIRKMRRLYDADKH